jgi:dimethylaniline monooxygenase (N-oxide forming)
MNNSNKTIGIIGFGVSGIAAAKECLKKGFKIQIFEKNSSLGGVWFSKSYPTCQLQTTKYAYCFSDVPHFDSTSLYPNREEILEYLKEVCNKFNIQKYVNYNCHVDTTKFDDEKQKWTITYSYDSNASLQFHCDYLIIASGFYTDNKKYKDITSQNLIGTKVFYPSDLSHVGKLTPDIFTNKKIVIIGNGPTGCDLATLAKDKEASSVKLLYRSKRWLFRRYLWNKVSTHFILNRLTMKIINYTNRIIFIIAVTVLYYIFYIFGHKYFFKIPTPFEPVTRNNLALNDKIVGMIYKGDIEYIQTNKTYITKDYVITSEKNIPYDICILAIGYQNNINFMNMNNIPKLYKHIIHPKYENCGFIGFAATFNWAQVSELQSKWFLTHINSRKKQKNKTQMLQDIQYENSHRDNKSADYHDLAIIVFDYCDELSLDIGLKNKYPIYNPKYWTLPPENDTWS